MRATTKFLFLGALAMCLSACLPTPPIDGEAPPIFRKPSRYGHGSPSNQGSRKPDKPAPSRNGDSPSGNGSGNRFGHTDGGGSGPDAGDSGPGTGPGPSGDKPPAGGGSGPDKKDMADGGGNSGGGNAPPSTPPSNLNDYPYARLVPGKKGFVTLSGKDAAVGEIDVTGIKPGTPVEINDPRDTSKKIYFRVP